MKFIARFIRIGSLLVLSSSLLLVGQQPLTQHSRPAAVRNDSTTNAPKAESTRASTNSALNETYNSPPNETGTKWSDELIKGLINCFFILISGAAAAFLWSFQQRRRELQLAAAHEFYGVYGEFLEILRIWKGLAPAKRLKLVLDDEEKRQEERWKLYVRACAAEGKVEAFLARLVSQQRLNDFEIRSTASFRQAYQILRQNIRDNKPILWEQANDPEYLTFKRYSCDLFGIAAKVPAPFSRRPGPGETSSKQAVIMSNEWERDAWKLSSDEIQQFKFKADTKARDILGRKSNH